ncbi:MAG: nucleoside kinase [Chloroflexi bacterium]|mgnify:CR=1 FL=1|nr:nucleoside kinase [Chloroflexota bacterium]
MAICEAQPRSTAQVRLSDGRVFEGPVGTPLADFMAMAFERRAQYPVVAALVGGELEELSYRVVCDVDVTPVDTRSTDGLRIYQRSLLFVMIVAMHELFSNVRVRVDHSVTLGGFYCQLLAGARLTPEELSAVSERMRAIIAAEEPIERLTLSTAEARRLFASQGYDDKVRLLDYREDEHLSVYRLRGHVDYFYGYMLPSAGLLNGFELQDYPPGMILRLTNDLHQLPLHSHREYPKLMGVFREYGEWLGILGVEDVGSLNEAVLADDLRREILVSEALHEKRLAEVADEITSRPEARIVLVAGPSSSGKTTFSKRLAVQLMVNGARPFAVALDDYFVDRELTPRDEHGEYDFESLEAIDRGLFVEQLMALMAGREVTLRQYDFGTGKNVPGRTVQLPPNAIIIVEGIHGLNPRLAEGLPPERVFRIYASALTQLNLDHHNRIATTDTRLLRRMVRDAQYRNYPAQMTIARWPSVRRGEERYIFPYQEHADVMFNTALVYELSVLRPYAEPLLRTVPHGTMEWVEARRLLSFLRWLRSCDASLVPHNSLLREFIGGSSLRDLSL